MDNRAEWLLIDFAVTLLGATLVPISTWSRPRELGYVLGHCDATTFITVDRFMGNDYLAMLAEIGEPGSSRLPLLRRVVSVDGARTASTGAAGGISAGAAGGISAGAAGGISAGAARGISAGAARGISAGAARGASTVPLDDLWDLGAGVGDGALDACQRAVSPDDVAYILYTSGTTSAPKGVQLQHRGLIENPWSIGERQHLGPDDRMWMGISLFWSFGCLNALLAVMTHGGSIVLQDQFDAGAALELIERERCTVYYGTPNIALALWEHPDRPRRDLSSLRTGAAIGPPPAMQMVMDLGVREVCNVYGLTECYGNSHVTDAADPADVRLHSVGRPLPGMEIRIVDRDTRRPLPPGEVGEILIRGHLTPGYYKDPERNAAAFDAEGFFLSGDLGMVDGDGRLYFRGRIKEMVKTGGINVAPLEVEEVLLGHGSVEQAYVVGLPDPRREEILAAAIVLKDRHAASEEELRAHCKQALAAFKVPVHFRIMARADLPVTATGKVQKFRLQELLAEVFGAPRE
jgi:fatty-acyl-CoA synthase